MHKHNLAVDEIAKNVRSKHQLGTPFYIYHGSSHRTRRTQFPADRIVDIRAFSTVSDVNREARTASVEANVSFAQLVKETLKKGLVAVVIPPFPDITVGGVLAGTSAGSSSFRYGYFEQSVNRVEIILGNGDTVNASPNEKADLFFALLGSLGTLGIATLLKIQLVPCSQYIKLFYNQVSSAKKAVQQLDQFSTTASEIEYLDTILFSEFTGIVIIGEAVHAKENPHRTI
jgi:FAD/FMN-containing dehydrogenase